MTQNNGGNAFPIPGLQHDEGFNGMTLRDWFATHAPAVPNDFDWTPGETDVAQRLVRWNWHYADLMLRAREQ